MHFQIFLYLRYILYQSVLDTQLWDSYVMLEFNLYAILKLMAKKSTLKLKTKPMRAMGESLKRHFKA